MEGLGALTPCSMSDKPPSETDDLEELRSVLADLEAKMESLQEVADEPEGDLSEIGELEDEANTTRSQTHLSTPRAAPEPLSKDLGTQVDPSQSIPEEGVLFDLNPEVSDADPGESAEPEATMPPLALLPNRPAAKSRPRADAPKRPSRREEKRRAREERKARSRAKKSESPSETRATPAPAVEEIISPEEEGDLSLSIDDLDMENPLPDAPYAPGMDHSELVMDRRKRRQEWEVRQELKEEEEQALWDLTTEKALEETASTRRFNFPVYLLLAFLVVLAAALIVLGVRTAIISMRAAKDGEDLTDREAEGLVAVGLEEAQKTLEDFLAAPTWEEKLPFVRKPDEAKPRMERFYSRPNAPTLAPLEKILSRVYNEIEGGDGFDFHCLLQDDSVVTIPVVRFPAEGPFYVIDWEALVDYVDLDWTVFLERRRPGDRRIYRLYASRDDYFSHGFASANQYLCVRLYDLEKRASAFGYVMRQTPIEHEIDAVLKLWERRRGARQGPKDPNDFSANWLREEQWAPMTLEVEIPEESGDNPYVIQLKIVRFVSPNWVIGDASGDGSSQEE